jgi:hypothetical protein
MGIPLYLNIMSPYHLCIALSLLVWQVELGLGSCPVKCQNRVNSRLSELMGGEGAQIIEKHGYPKYFVWCIHRSSQISLHFFTQLMLF